MSDYNSNPEILNIEEMENRRLPATLNVLTILTMIASSWGIISAISGYFSVCKSLEMVDEMKPQELGGSLGKFMNWITTTMQEMTPKLCDNKLAILIVSVVAYVLCLVGAVQMRKRMKIGFTLYSVGELLYPVVFVALGISFDPAIIAMNFIWPGLFLLLYFFQRKHLTN